MQQQHSRNSPSNQSSQTKAAKPKKEMGQKRVPTPYPTNINGRCTIEKPESQIAANFPPSLPATTHDET